MALPWEESEGRPHDIVERGEFYECELCGKMSTSKMKLYKTVCTHDTD